MFSARGRKILLSVHLALHYTIFLISCKIVFLRNLQLALQSKNQCSSYQVNKHLMLTVTSTDEVRLEVKMEYIELMIGVLSRLWLLWVAVGVMAFFGIAEAHNSRKRKIRQKIQQNRKEYEERAKQ